MIIVNYQQKKTGHDSGMVIGLFGDGIKFKPYYE